MDLVDLEVGVVQRALALLGQIRVWSVQVWIYIKHHGRGWILVVALAASGDPTT